MVPVELSLLACVAAVLLFPLLGDAIAEPQHLPAAAKGAELESPPPPQADPPGCGDECCCKQGSGKAAGTNEKCPPRDESGGPKCNSQNCRKRSDDAPGPRGPPVSGTRDCKTKRAPPDGKKRRRLVKIWSVITEPRVTIYGDVKIVIINHPKGEQAVSLIESQNINVAGGPAPPSGILPVAPVAPGPGARPRSPCSGRRPAPPIWPCPVAPPSRPSAASQFGGLICGGEKGQIQCLFGKTVKIEAATYGRRQRYACWKFSPSAAAKQNTNCGMDVTARLQQLCKGKKACFIHATDAVMGGDPCPGTSKYLSVKARCV